MTMDRPQLENDLYAAISSAFNLDKIDSVEVKEESALVYEELARELSIAIDAYIKTATVIVTTDTSVVLSVTDGEASSTGAVNSTGDLE